MRQKCFMLLCAVLFWMSCSNPKPTIETKDNYIVDEVDEQAVDDTQYFLPNEDGYVYITDEIYLELLYKWNYSSKYQSFESFKKCAVERSINLDYKTLQCDTCVFYYYYDRFVIDQEIRDYYNNNGLEKFKKKYCCEEKTEISSDKRHRYNHLKFNSYSMNYEKGKKFTIAYFLWLNGYTYEYDNCFSEEFFYKPVG